MCTSVRSIDLQTLQEQVVVHDSGITTTDVSQLQGEQCINMVTISRCCSTNGSISTKSPDTTTKNTSLIAPGCNNVASNRPVLPIAGTINVNGPCAEECQVSRCTKCIVRNQTIINDGQVVDITVYGINTTINRFAVINTDLEVINGHVRRRYRHDRSRGDTINNRFNGTVAIVTNQRQLLIDNDIFTVAIGTIRTNNNRIAIYCTVNGICDRFPWGIRVGSREISTTVVANEAIYIVGFAASQDVVINSIWREASETSCRSRGCT